ncbi:MAG: nitrogen regulation protein NR(I), partial [Magnetococcales bacterium]|nr:nitrogen regulation protein NR(I) [Magnetococcales bacterium]
MNDSTSKTILVADDDPSIRFVLEHALVRSGFHVRCFDGGEKLLDHMHNAKADLVITDIVMPSGSGLDLLKTLKERYPLMPVIVITAQSTLRNAVHAFERGAFEYLPKPFDINTLVDLVNRSLIHSRPVPEFRENPELDRFGGIIGSSMAMQELFRVIGRLANSEMTVLIHGESGTGKELVARAIHACSPRRNQPFTAINMAAIPRSLIESELFGHEKGAFTGAISRRPGHFEQARGGSLFLDEIGDMPMEAQTRLLRVLQDGTYTQVGSTQTMRSDVRIIAASHQDLPAAIGAGRFREDLFYRLNVIPIHVPSLRSRREDIPLLADFFLGRAAKEHGLPRKRLAPATLERLTTHVWPGNVRELENLIHRLMVLVPDETIQPNHLDLPEPRQVDPPPIGSDVASRSSAEGAAAPATFSPPSSHPNLPLQQAIHNELDRFFASLNGIPPANLYDFILRLVEEPLLNRVLLETRGNQVKAAQVLGINRNTLRKKIQELGIT